MLLRFLSWKSWFSLANHKRLLSSDNFLHSLIFNNFWQSEVIQIPFPVRPISTAKKHFQQQLSGKVVSLVALFMFSFFVANRIDDVLCKHYYRSQGLTTARCAPAPDGFDMESSAPLILTFNVIWWPPKCFHRPPKIE